MARKKNQKRQIKKESSKLQVLLKQEARINKKTLHDKTLHTVVGVLFAFIAIFHLVRFALGLPLTIGYYDVSLWISLVAAIGLGYLAIWVWKGV